MTKERGIILNGEEVRAILDGLKTQTRRVVKCKYDWHIGYDDNDKDCPFYEPYVFGEDDIRVECPYGRPGDRLYVRETWSRMQEEDGGGYVYRADFPQENEFLLLYGFWNPSARMPRAASRILLEITDVRVERLQDISESDAIAEGITGNFGFWKDYINNNDTAPNLPSESYKSFMQKKYGADFVDKNPWMWAITFNHVKK